MAPGPKIVHKQFNSPIGLYSQQNIQETLSKHVHQLNNGAVGIDFSDPTTSKPNNLANSSVLRMLEDEERQRRGLPNKKKVVWPPAPETNGYHSGVSPIQGQQQQQPQSQSQQQPLSVDTIDYARGPPAVSPGQYQVSPTQVSPRQGAGVTRLVPVGAGVQLRQPYAPASPQPYTPPPFSQQPYSQQSYSQPPYSQPPYSQQPYSQPPFSQQPFGQQPFSSEPFHPQGYATLPARPQPASPSTRWAPVGPPVSHISPQHSPLYYEGGVPAQYESPAAPRYEPPLTTIELRPHQPVHQRPPPVFASQPAAASFQGGVNMRGDQKWPPESVKVAVAAENQARVDLAKGPACRPRRVRKDYTGFFAQNALNNNYPGYRVPPGTQHYEDQSGQTSF